MDQHKYLAEMTDIVARAIHTYAREARPPILSFNVWADPRAAVSAINIDTQAHSDRRLAEMIEYASRQRLHFLRSGNKRMADLFLAPTISREDNPAEFAYSEIAKCAHRAFGSRWRSDEDCWDIIEPLLLVARDRAAGLLVKSSLPLEADAEVSVNDRRSWYASPIRMLEE